MGKKKSPNRKTMPPNQPLYKGGASSNNSGKKKSLKTTLTIDALIIQFPDLNNIESSLRLGNLKLSSFHYYIKDCSQKNGYKYYAKIYSKDIFLGNLFYKQTIYHENAKRKLLLQITKERFYSGEDWLNLIKKLFDELGIKTYDIKRIDLALDTAENLIPVIADYLEKDFTPKSGCKRVSRMNVKGGRSIRYNIDENRKSIAIYKKDFADIHLTKSEEKLTTIEYKKTQKYQVDYWQKNGLVNVDAIIRVEIRLTGKYANRIKLSALCDISKLTGIYFKEIGKNLTFIEETPSGIKEHVVLNSNNLLINNEKVYITESFLFKPSKKLRDIIRMCYRAKFVKVIKTTGEDSGIVDTGDGLLIEIKLNPNKDERRVRKYLLSQLFTDEELNRIRPEKSLTVSFREATIKGQAPDKGLYFPDRIPVMSAELISSLSTFSKAEIAYQVIHPYVGGEIPDTELYKICEETVAFDFPLQKINDSIYSLELFHGPTLAFKDVGARFMSRCLGHFSKKQDQKVTVLVATSGDTGSAVANGFLGVDGVDVVILYPSGKVSKVQELQLTTLGQNIRALEVSGTFDDCQAMVKQAFTDEDLIKHMFLTSANSINVARWLPQQFYYFYAWQQWKENSPPVICVPSGNFGNVCAGLLAHVSGLPAAHFVVACNENDVFSEYLSSGSFHPKTAVPTISNAMDVGNPSNFVRILELFRQDHALIKKTISSYCINDALTADTISEVYQKYGYLLDPHGAVAYRALDLYLKDHLHHKGFILETAHPVKFSDVVEKITGREIEIPESIHGLLSLRKQSKQITADYAELKGYLLKN